MDNHIYIPQTKYLATIIRSIWQVNRATFCQHETIIPKGVIEIIFDLGENVAIDSRIDSRDCRLSKCFINGFNTRPIQFRLPEKQLFFGVQFHPVVIKQLFSIPAREFANNLIDLGLIDRSFNSLWQQLGEAKTFGERVNIISAWLENKITATQPQELLLNSFLEKNDSHSITIPALAKKSCYSTRQLSRKVYELTGMNTEQLLLYKKYLHAVQLMHHTDLSLTEISYQSNFADQSHFIRSFKTFASMKPNEYRQHKGHIAGHLLHNVR